eukprot:m.65670 g.65670  ORF g.65670 m.65670 type:complete len:68 (+) comp11750_c1_seq3:176-379(+)
MGDKVAYLVIIFLSLAPQLVQTGVLYVTFAPAFTSKEVNAVSCNISCCFSCIYIRAGEVTWTLLPWA